MLLLWLILSAFPDTMACTRFIVWQAGCVRHVLPSTPCEVGAWAVCDVVHRSMAIEIPPAP